MLLFLRLWYSAPMENTVAIVMARRYLARWYVAALCVGWAEGCTPSKAQPAAPIDVVVAWARGHRDRAPMAVRCKNNVCSDRVELSRDSVLIAASLQSDPSVFRYGVFLSAATCESFGRHRVVLERDEPFSANVPAQHVVRCALDDPELRGLDVRIRTTGKVAHIYIFPSAQAAPGEVDPKDLYELALSDAGLAIEPL
jgi:hypothetical protein